MISCGTTTYNNVGEAVYLYNLAKRWQMGDAAQQEYRKLLLEGKSEKEAAKIAQERTGISLVTGKPIRKDIPYKKDYSGQYGGKNA